MLNSSKQKRVTFGLTVIGLLAAWPQAASASESLRPSLAKIAAAVAKIVHSRGADSVAVGQFSGPPNFGSNAGPGIQQVLSDELKEMGLKVKKFGAALGVRGEYLYTSVEDGADPDFKQIRLKVVLTDGSGQPLTSLNQDVDFHGPPGPVPPRPGPPGTNPPPDVHKIVIREGEIDLDTFTGGEEAAALLGVTWDFERSGLGLDVSKDIVADSFERPTAQILNGTAVRASPSSPYFLEVMVGNRPLPLRLEDGQPVVDLQVGQTIVFRVTNRAKHDVSAELMLDGVNTFAFSRERKPTGERLKRYIVAKNSWFLVNGWHKTFSSVTEFKMAPLGSGQTAYELVGGESGLGMITVVIRGSWKFDESPPASEPFQAPQLVQAQAPTLDAAAPGDADASFGTFGAANTPTGSTGPATVGSPAGGGNNPRPAFGLGRENQQQSHAVSDRQTGVVRSLVTIRYDKPKN